MGGGKGNLAVAQTYRGGTDAMNNPRKLSTVWGLVSAEGIESALKRTFNKMQSSGRQF